MPNRKPLEYVPPEKFAELRDKAGAKNIELARELGVSPTRMTELTRTKGGTVRQFKRVKDALTGLRARRREDRQQLPSKTGGNQRQSRATRARRLRPIHA